MGRLSRIQNPPIFFDRIITKADTPFYTLDYAESDIHESIGPIGSSFRENSCGKTLSMMDNASTSRITCIANAAPKTGVSRCTRATFFGLQKKPLDIGCCK